MPDFSPLHFDLTGQAELVRQKEISPKELLELSIEAVELLNPKLNAIVRTMYDEARAALESGLPPGPFYGVPFMLKDGMATYKGVPTSNSSPITANSPAKRDSELVKRYKAMGLQILAKTNLPEFGLLPVTESFLHGPCFNPWDLNKTPGGSSGGSSAAVAARIVAAAHANDGGGSIRIPASCCGLFGLKPSRGRTPLGPVISEAVSGLVIEHVVSRSVRDSAALLEYSCGEDVGVPYFAPPKEHNYLEIIEKPPRPLKIGYSLGRPNGKSVHPDCEAAMNHTLKLCEEMGHELIEMHMPQTYDGRQLAEMFTILWAAGTTTVFPLYERATGSLPAQEMAEPLTWALYELSQKYTALDYEMARLGLMRYGRKMAELFEEMDLWMSPTLAKPPVTIGEFDQKRLDPMEVFKLSGDFSPCTAIFNVSGQPAASLPTYWNEAGLPIGVQVVGKFGDEAGVFQFAAEMERAVMWIDKKPGVSV
jgi:amidase